MRGVAAALLLLTAVPACAADPDALWKIVHGRCVPHFEASGDPAPCLAADPGQGYALLKDIVGASQILLIPTARISGIESPDLLAAGVPPYFGDAWAARARVGGLLHHALPDDALGLAINAQGARSQNQFHIHIDCLAVPVIEALRAHRGAIGPQWSLFPVPLAGQAYQAMRIDAAALPGLDPFRLLADGVPGAAAAMGQYTLVLAGADAGGALLLAGAVDPLRGDFGHGEDLQDHACAVAE